MNLVKLMAGGAAVAAIAAAFRDFRNGGWLSPALPRRGVPGSEVEPVLGYDGMDQETLIDWITDANLDRDTLTRLREYERAHRNREPVLSAAEDLL